MRDTLNYLQYLNFISFDNDIDIFQAKANTVLDISIIPNELISEEEPCYVEISKDELDRLTSISCRRPDVLFVCFFLQKIRRKHKIYKTKEIIDKMVKCCSVSMFKKYTAILREERLI